MPVCGSGRPSIAGNAIRSLCILSTSTSPLSFSKSTIFMFDSKLLRYLTSTNPEGELSQGCQVSLYHHVHHRLIDPGRPNAQLNSDHLLYGIDIQDPVSDLQVRVELLEVGAMNQHRREIDRLLPPMAPHPMKRQPFRRSNVDPAAEVENLCLQPGEPRQCLSQSPGSIFQEWDARQGQRDQPVFRNISHRDWANSAHKSLTLGIE
ncbi:hypothetical protein F5H01DRAFT_370943 [Linnemannia elongata]|nr:hypothetical protein F5H01DRAFT_370943 [Linnemannia elongata]